MPSDDNKVRWGILGVAKIGERLIPALSQAANVELRAIASRTLAKAQAAAKMDSIPMAYGSYEQLLDDPNIDAVYIPLPNNLHAEWTMKAAERGKHILCEKPLAVDAAEARKIVDFCRKKKVFLMDGFMWPHHPRTAKLRQLLDNGGIGEVRRVHGAFTFAMDLNPRNIRLQSGLAGGSLLDVGCYPVYGARWAFQVEPVRVFAIAEMHNGVDIGMCGVLEFPGGKTATFDCGFTLPYRGHMEIVGTQATVLVQHMWLPTRRAWFEIRREGRPVEETVIVDEDQIVHMVHDFSLAILNGHEPTPSPDEAVATMRVLDALAKSVKEGKPVAVE